MNTQTQEALHKALKVLNCLNNNRVYETAWVKGAINACEEALASNSEALAHPAQEPVAWIEEEFNAIAYAYRTCPAHEIKMVSDRYQELVNYVLSITHPTPSIAQEPVAWMFIGTDENKYLNFYKCLDEGRNIPLYAKENVDD